MFDSALHSFVTTPTSQICTESISADFPNTQAASATHKPRKVVFKNYKHFQTTSNESPVQQQSSDPDPPPPPPPRTVMHTGMPEVVVHESSHEDTYNQALPAFLYCKQQKAACMGRGQSGGQGMRLCNIIWCHMNIFLFCTCL